MGKALLALYDSTQAMDNFEPSCVDMSDPEQAAIYKTIRVLKNQSIFADSCLRM